MKRQILMCVFVFTLSAQVTNEEIAAKVDTVINNQEKMIEEAKNDPLTGKKYGVEVNPFSLLTIDKNRSFAAGFSIFKPESNIEIAFPIQYASNRDDNDDDEDYYYDNSYNELKAFTLDVQFRKFLGTSADGFYLSAFARYAHLRGHLGKDSWLSWDTEPSIPEYGSENKFGLGFGIGYRIFSYSGFYWGVNLSLGRYFIGENDKFRGEFISIDNDNELFISGEILKFGYAF